MSNLGAAYTDIERTMKHQPPLIRGLLYFQYGRPQVTGSVQRGVDDYVDFVFGEDIGRGERDRVARAVRRVRRNWARLAMFELFGAEAPKDSKEKIQ